jgi:nucleotide-binding universal stress UspA family protein
MKPPFRSLLIATDLSPLGNCAVSIGYLLAGAGATVRLLHVVAPPDTGNPLYPDERPANAPTPAQIEASRAERKRRLLALVPADATSRRIQSEAVLAEGEDVAMEIETAARSLRPEVVVLSSHGRWGFSRLLHGESVSTRLLHEKDLDLVVVHTDRP